MSFAIGASILAYLPIINIAAFLTFAWDKRCARKKNWRVSERTLLMLALLGGTFGAMEAQQRLRHKTYKEPFRTSLRNIAIFQAVVIAFMAGMFVQWFLGGSINSSI